MSEEEAQTEKTQIPSEGDPFTIADLEMVFNLVKKRRENFPTEDPKMSFGVVLFNLGDRYSPVTCVNGEWSGIKQDLIGGSGVPQCPNGHVCMQGPGLKLGWINEIGQVERENHV